MSEKDQRCRPEPWIKLAPFHLRGKVFPNRATTALLATACLKQNIEFIDMLNHRH